MLQKVHAHVYNGGTMSQILGRMAMFPPELMEKLSISTGIWRHALLKDYNCCRCACYAIAFHLVVIK